MIELTVVTVNYNSGGGLELTVNSLADYLSDPRVELVLIDACSSDQSSDFIENNKDSFGAVVIEPDKGIYDAMNKAIKMAKGKWVWFVNSGDLVLAQSNVLLERLSSSKNISTVIYSDLTLSNGLIIQQSSNLTFLMRRMINHQNIIYSKDILKVGYDIKFKYCADFAHMMNSFKALTFIKFDQCLCLYDVDGVSSNRSYMVRQLIWQERYLAMRNSNTFFFSKIGSLFALAIVGLFCFINSVKRVGK
ncbi:glycosyltransferase [Aeromonas veronii]